MNKLGRTIGWTAACGAMALLAGCGGGGDAGTGAMGDINGSGATVFKRGAVTGFGSVIVEGQRFETGQATVEIDDVPGAESNLRVGQIVEVTGTRRADDSLVAERIRYDAELRGPVSAIDAEEDTFELAGQIIRVNGATIFDDTDFATLAVGDRVEVSGEITGDGEFLASYVEAEDDSESEIEVTGRVAELDEMAESFQLRELSIDYAGATIEDGPLADGALVEVKGSLSGNTLTASDIEVEDRPGASDDDDEERLEAGTEIEITGPVAALDEEAGSFRVRRYLVRFDGDTEIDGEDGALANGAFVEVEGVLNEQGEVVAQSIEFEDRRAPGNRVGRIELEGLIGDIDSEAGSITVESVVIATDERTRYKDDRDEQRSFGFSDLRVGDAVEIAAVRRGPQGDVVALRIEREDEDAEEDDNDGSGDADGDESGDEQELAGEVESIDESQSQLTVLGVTVDASAAEFEGEEGELSREEFFQTVQVGDFVEVEGRFEGERFIARSVEREAPDDDAGDDEERPDEASQPEDGSADGDAAGDDSRPDETSQPESDAPAEGEDDNDDAQVS